MTRECWLFLDCQVMTGHPPKKCPNYIACQNNALNSSNRVCTLPYERWLPINNRYLFVLHLLHQDLTEAGWKGAVALPYHYDPGKLEVGWLMKGMSYWIEEEAIAGGYQIAEDLPYNLMDKPKQLRVVHRVNHSQKNAGWGSPVDFPLRRRKDPDRWEVDFDYLNPDFKDAIAAGWHPAEFIEPQEFPW